MPRHNFIWAMAIFRVISTSRSNIPKFASAIDPAMRSDEAMKRILRFLLQVMNDDSVAMSLRVEAAKALLQHSTGT